MNMKKILVAWLLFFPAIILAQFEAKGTVTDDEGNPLPGVLVTESMTNNSVTTDFDGNFVIEVASDGASLIGKSQSVHIKAIPTYIPNMKNSLWAKLPYL